jgi:hypothetical protein
MPNAVLLKDVIGCILSGIHARCQAMCNAERIEEDAVRIFQDWVSIIPELTGHVIGEAGAR